MTVQKVYRLGIVLAVGLFLNAVIGLANLFAHPKPVYAQAFPGQPQAVIITGCNIPPQFPGGPIGTLPVYIAAESPQIRSLAIPGHGLLTPEKPK